MDANSCITSLLRVKGWPDDVLAGEYMQGGGTAVMSLLCVFGEPAHDEQKNIDPHAFGSVFKPLPHNVSFA